MPREPRAFLILQNAHLLNLGVSELREFNEGSADSRFLYVELFDFKIQG
jgi:hypothetical protein